MTVTNRIRSPKRATVEECFWQRVKKTETCWLWFGGTRHGYGAFYDRATGRHRPAHRWSYEHHVGPIPDGLVLDHLCRVLNCVNPEHLEPVTQRENTLRGVGGPAVNAVKTECQHGHPFDAENTYINYKGDRMCRTCERKKSLRRRARQKAAPPVICPVCKGSFRPDGLNRHIKKIHSEGDR